MRAFKVRKRGVHWSVEKLNEFRFKKEYKTEDKAEWDSGRFKGTIKIMGQWAIKRHDKNKKYIKSRWRR